MRWVIEGILTWGNEEIRAISHIFAHKDREGRHEDRLQFLHYAYTGKDETLPLARLELTRMGLIKKKEKEKRANPNGFPSYSAQKVLKLGQCQFNI